MSMFSLALFSYIFFERVLEMERERGSSVQTSMAMRNIMTLFAGGIASNRFANLLASTAMHVVSPLRPTPSLESIETWSYKNTMPAVQTYMLAASAAGIGTCPMEGFDGRRVARLLDIPDRYSIPCIVATGYEQADAQGGPTQRLPAEEVIFMNHFGAPAKAAGTE
jgi:nitroreductase